MKCLSKLEVLVRKFDALINFLLGKFQWFTLICYIMAFTSGGFIIYTYDYNVIKPSILCEDPLGSGIFSSCTIQSVCDK